MARRKVSRKFRNRRKLQPAVMTLTIPIGLLNPGITAKTADISQICSIVNRRFYRQGLQWAVAGFTLHAKAGITGNMAVKKLPNTWSLSNGWEKVFRAWKRQQDEALEDGSQQSVKARFNDFKIFMDGDHRTATFGDNLLPAVTDTAGTWIDYAPGEWDPTPIVIPNYGGAPGVTQEIFLKGVGAAASSCHSLIQLYEDSRSVPHSPDPDVPGDVLNTNNLLSLMFDVGSDNTEVLENVVGENDQLPYDQINYPGGANQAPQLQFHDMLTATATTIDAKITGRGGNFPCGLVRFDLDSGLGASSVEGQVVPNAYIQIHLVPGPHRGYMAESMTEM